MKVKDVSTNKKGVLNSAQLRQKVIYYQSEAAKYKFLSEKYEWIISQALQYNNGMVDEKEVEQPPQEEPNSISYFNYSLIQDETNTPLIYGNFVIKNIGSVTLHSPVICLKVNDPNRAIIGGKIGEVSGADDKLMSFEEWAYVHDDWRKKWNEQGELWLKPKQTNTIESEGKLVFAGFDVTFTKTENLKPILIEAYFYCKEFPKGIKSLNSLSITL